MPQVSFHWGDNPPLHCVVPTPEERAATADFIRETKKILSRHQTPERPRRWRQLLSTVGHGIHAIGSIISKAGGGIMGTGRI